MGKRSAPAWANLFMTDFQVIDIYQLIKNMSMLDLRFIDDAL